MRLTHDIELLQVPPNLHDRGWPYRQEGRIAVDLADLAEWADQELDVRAQHQDSRRLRARVKAAALERRAAAWDADEEELRVRRHRTRSEWGQGQSRSAAWRRAQAIKRGEHGQEKQVVRGNDRRRSGNAAAQAGAGNAA